MIPRVSSDRDPRARFETTGTDLDVASRMFEGAYDGTDFVGSQTVLPFTYRFRSTGDERMSFRSTRFDARMRGEVEPRDDYVVTWTSSGGGRVDVDRDEVRLRPGVPVMFPTGRPFVFDLADITQSLVQFERTYLEKVAAEFHGEQPGPLVFDHTAEPPADAIARWQAQVREAASVVLGPGPTTELALAETSYATAVVLLRTFPHRILSAPLRMPDGATGRVRDAIEFMHAFAHTPITTTDVAAQVGLSVRGLQQAFQRQIGSAPNSVLRGIRLDRVRDELVVASVEETTVASVAQRWGFAHLGRFSGAYATRFGEYPSRTLQD